MVLGGAAGVGAAALKVNGENYLESRAIRPSTPATQSAPPAGAAATELYPTVSTTVHVAPSSREIPQPEGPVAARTVARA